MHTCTCTTPTSQGYNYRLLLGLSLPEQAMRWLPLRFGIGRSMHASSGWIWISSYILIDLLNVHFVQSRCIIAYLLFTELTISMYWSWMAPTFQLASTSPFSSKRRGGSNRLGTSCRVCWRKTAALPQPWRLGGSSAYRWETRSGHCWTSIMP